MKAFWLWCLSGAIIVSCITVAALTCSCRVERGAVQIWISDSGKLEMEQGPQN